MIALSDFVADFSKLIESQEKEPWIIIQELDQLIREQIKTLDKEYLIDQGIAIHKTAVIDPGATIKGPAILHQNSFVGSNSILRNGVILMPGARIGTACEIKSSIVFDQSAIAHFNFIGDSIIGKHVNFEAGSITANHYNERENKDICVLYLHQVINTKVQKFGALVGDYSKIGANAVLSPGTLLTQGSVVNRLELIEQIKE